MSPNPTVPERWSEIPSESYKLQTISKVEDIRVPPVCKCGATMRSRSGYLMGGKSDWIAYECPKDGQPDYESHSPWTTQIKRT